MEVRLHSSGSFAAQCTCCTECRPEAALKYSTSKLNLQFSKLLIAAWCVYLILNMPLKYFDYLSEGISSPSFRFSFSSSGCCRCRGIVFLCPERPSWSIFCLALEWPIAKRLKRLVALKIQTIRKRLKLGQLTNDYKQYNKLLKINYHFIII